MQPPRHSHKIELALPIDSRSLRHAALICLGAIAIASTIFAFFGAVFDINGMLSRFGGTGQPGVIAIGYFLWFFYTLACIAIYSGTFLIIGFLLVFFAFVLLRALSFVIRVRAPVARWLVIAVSAGCGGLTGILGVGIWQPIGNSTWFAAALTAASAALLTWHKAMPLPNQSRESAQAAAPGLLPRSPWKDLE
ncbi:MAG: hypothetical protein RL215_2000 [Planctomycetota bacterium]|jgi:hypothetical protein